MAVTALTLSLALGLGSWAYRHRRGSLHEGRLRRLLEAKPTSWQVSEALRAEGAMEVEVPPTDDQLRRLATQWSPGSADDVVARRRQWHELRIYGLPDVLYFLYFDGEGVLRDYVLLAR